MNKKTEKLENNSIPVNIADMIIDEIPVEMWSNPNNKYCYASIVDSYIIDSFINRLNLGLQNIIIDDVERMNHILNNMIYGIALDKYSARLTKAITKINNIFVKNITQDDLTDMPKFDYIIQNPPYNKSLHLEFFKKGIELLSEDGKMTIIEPATWLINVRKTGKAKLYDELKQKLSKHIYKVVIENYNKEFEIDNYVPLSVTYIDLKNEYETIDFWCCGDHKTVNNIYDCNMIGSYDMIWSILNKIKFYGDLMKTHIYKPGKSITDNNIEFINFADILGQGGCGGHGYKQIDRNYNESEFQKTNIGVYHNQFIDVFIRRTETKTYQLYGSKQELENWKHFIFNNKIPLFTSIVLVIDQNNTTVDVLCWLTDKQYTDDEIYKLLNITKEEQDFIDKTLKKYERNSPWFKRYLCGKDSVSDEEVQKFINKL